jgi:hypothetical protein
MAKETSETRIAGKTCETRETSETRKATEREVIALQKPISNYRPKILAVGVDCVFVSPREPADPFARRIEKESILLISSERNPTATLVKVVNGHCTPRFELVKFYLRRIKYATTISPVRGQASIAGRMVRG